MLTEFLLMKKCLKPGSIREGKKADFVLLDKNPFKIPKEEIRNIKVIGVM